MNVRCDSFLMKRVCLGRIADAHGVKGLVKILPYGDDPQLIEDLSPVFTDETDSKTLTITMKNSAGNKYWLASVDGVTERDGALELRGTELWVDRESLPEIESKNTFYHTDLIGLEVRDESGGKIGDVIAVQNYGAGDLLEIKPLKGSAFLVPMTKDNFPEIKPDAGYINSRNTAAFMDIS